MAIYPESIFLSLFGGVMFWILLFGLFGIFDLYVQVLTRRCEFAPTPLSATVANLRRLSGFGSDPVRGGNIRRILSLSAGIFVGGTLARLVFPRWGLEGLEVLNGVFLLLLFGVLAIVAKRLWRRRV